MNDFHIGHEGEWRQVKEAYIEQNGEWVPQRIRMVGHNGQWVETYDADPVEAKEIVDMTHISYRAGTQLQGALELLGRGFDVTPIPDPPVGAFYPLAPNLGDRLENFANLVAHGTEQVLPTIVDGVSAYVFDPSKQQYLSAPLSTNSPDAYYDLLGLMGNDGASSGVRGAKHWEIGAKFRATALPAEGQVAFIIFSGTATQYIAVGFDSTGALFAKFHNNTYEKVLTINGAVVPGKWLGFVFRHRPDAYSRFLELQTNAGELVSIEGDILRNGYKEFSYWVPPINCPINIGYGVLGSEGSVATSFFTLENTNPSLLISSDGLEIQSTLTTYRNSLPSGLMHPGTGRYYLQLENNTSYDIQFGVTNEAFQSAQAPGVIGWCVNTIAGRKFAKQTGGGTAWTSAIPANSTIGMVYDSDAGLIEVYVNGVKRANPFAAGTIAVPVRFIIGGRAGSATANLLKARVTLDPALWTSPPAGPLLPVPYSVTAGASSEVYSGGAYREIFFRNQPMTEARTALVLAPDIILDVIFTNENTQEEHNANLYVLKREDTKIIMSVPEVEDGNYKVSCRYQGVEESNYKMFTVKSFQSRLTPLHIDFATDSVDKIRKELLVAHKQWGGINGGVSADNVILDRVNGTCEITALGDEYVGPVKGVDRYGKPSGFDTRIGGCIVTRDYFGPGSYRALCKAASIPGVCNALWTFHYEEGYPGSPLYDMHIQDGIHVSGNAVDGFYTVRNHEIDIEFPTALKSTPDQEDVSFTNARFNTWRGELRNWNVPNPDVPMSDPLYSPEPDPEYWSEYTDDFVNHGVNLGDEEFHELRFDWHLGADPRVEFYIDGVLHHTVRTNIPDIPGRYWVGMWFPSGSSHWAGRGAPWVKQHMIVKEISITPFPDEVVDEVRIPESYPSDFFRDFKTRRAPF